MRVQFASLRVFFPGEKVAQVVQTAQVSAVPSEMGR